MLHPTRLRSQFVTSKHHPVANCDRILRSEDGRKLGTLIPGSRKQKELSADKVEKVAAVYRQFRCKGIPDEVPGFCKAAKLDEIREHKYALTPGRYVGATEENADDSRSQLVLGKNPRDSPPNITTSHPPRILCR